MVAIPGCDEPPITPVASARRTRQATAILALVGLVSWAAVVLVQLPRSIVKTTAS